MKNTKSQNTSLLIQQLVANLNEPSETLNWNINYWFSWFSCISMMAIMTYFAAAFFPKDIHLPQNLKNSFYWFESFFWLFLGFLAALITSSLARPRVASRWVSKLALLVFVLLMFSICLNITPKVFASQLHEELHWTQGPCGFFILMTGVVSALWMFYIVKKAAPVDLLKTSVWVAVSVGSLGAFFMHLVCTHENSVHTLLWHLLPLFVLTVLSMELGKKILRW